MWEFTFHETFSSIIGGMQWYSETKHRIQLLNIEQITTSRTFPGKRLSLWYFDTFHTRRFAEEFGAWAPVPRGGTNKGDKKRHQRRHPRSGQARILCTHCNSPVWWPPAERTTFLTKKTARNLVVKFYRTPRIDF